MANFRIVIPDGVLAELGRGGIPAGHSHQGFTPVYVVGVAGILFNSTDHRHHALSRYPAADAPASYTGALLDQIIESVQKYP